MKTYTPEEVDAKNFNTIRFDFGRDMEGQIIIFTNIYEWEDGSYHDEPELNQPTHYQLTHSSNPAT